MKHLKSQNHNMANKTKKVKRITTRKEPHVTLVKIISDFIGKDEKKLMFGKVKGKLFLFVFKSKTMGKIPLEEEPKAYPAKEFENFGAFLYKLNREEKKAK